MGALFSCATRRSHRKPGAKARSSQTLRAVATGSPAQRRAFSQTLRAVATGIPARGRAFLRRYAPLPQEFLRMGAFFQTLRAVAAGMSAGLPCTAAFGLLL